MSKPSFLEAGKHAAVAAALMHEHLEHQGQYPPGRVRSMGKIVRFGRRR